MKVRMIFGTHLEPAAPGEDLIELKCNSTQDLDSDIAAGLVAAGRAEYLYPPKGFKAQDNYSPDTAGNAPATTTTSTPPAGS